MCRLSRLLLGSRLLASKTWTQDGIARRKMSTAPTLHRYRLTANSHSSPACHISTSTGHSMGTDLPKAVGGQDEWAQPVELLLASLVGCKTATAHFVARHMWPRRQNRIAAIEFTDVEAVRDVRGALSLPVDEDAPVSSAILHVSGIASVRPHSTEITQAEVAALGKVVEGRCPVAATLAQGGVRMTFEWRLLPPLDEKP